VRAASPVVPASGPAPRTLARRFADQWDLQAMALPGVVFLVVFAYIPMAGVLLAFKEEKLGRVFYLDGAWVGFQNFLRMFSDEYFRRALLNTVAMAFVELVISFPLPILLALIISEMPGRALPRVVQTASYMPYFISFVIVANMWTMLLDEKGVVNGILQALGVTREPIWFWGEPGLFWWLAALVNAWKSMGFNAVVFLATIAGLPEEMYEAAVIDGAGRLRRIFSLTLPNMLGIITMMLILSSSGLVKGSLDVSLLLGNPFNRQRSYVIEYYTLQMGLENARFAFATAISLFQSVVGLAMAALTNWLSGRVGGSRLF
jgi:putative aldouronate transport system permease protein